MKRLFMMAAVWACGWVLSQAAAQTATADFHVIPLPQEIQPAGTADFVLNSQTVIVCPKGNKAMERDALALAHFLKLHTGLALDVSKKPVASNAIVLSLGLSDPNAEAYRISVSGESIRIEGASEAGVYYGIQTLRKSVPAKAGRSVRFPAVEVKDAPRFAYRGAHLDVSRHFFPVDSVKRFIDMLALHNINRFHWHLTDDQGWRIEIKKYPKLTRVGAWRAETVIGHNSGKYDGKPYGGFYTQKEAKDIVEYAAQRHIIVIPEIDLPGHMQAALAAYPELGCTGGPYEVWRKWGVSDNVLCAGNDHTLGFINDVLAEIIRIFPSEYIHVGGDECPKTQWAKCPKCQARIKELGLKADEKHTAEERLQSFVIGHAEKFLNSKGRQIIGWDEILEGGLAPNATVMSWRGTKGGLEAARQKHNVIMTPNTYLYFDYYQSSDVQHEPLAIGGYLPVEKVYSYEPMDKTLSADEARYIVGVQANLWTEYIPTYGQVEYMELPRMAALAEVQWTRPEKKDYRQFLKRLLPMVDIYKACGYNYAKHVFEVKAECTPNLEKGVQEVKLYTIDDAPIYYTLDGSRPSTASARYEGPLQINKSCTLKAAVIRPSGENGKVFSQTFRINKATLKPVKLLQPTAPQYTYKGEQTLVDGLWGGKGYTDGHWLGFYGHALEAVVDLGRETPVCKAWVRVNVHVGDQIFDLRRFSVAVSDDGVNFREVQAEEYQPVEKGYKDDIYVRQLSFEPVTARYLKFTAQPEMKISGGWHYGEGRPAFIFVDEIGAE